MKKLTQILGIAALTCMSFTTACGSANTATQAESTGDETEIIETASSDLTFADLSHYSFSLGSGAGAFATELTIEKDGYFHGMYHDSDMGDTGEGYDNGTVYTSHFSGHFTDLTKTDDTVWTTKIADISYQDTVGETQIDVYEQIRYIYTSVFDAGTTMQVYWKGTPTADLSENMINQLKNRQGNIDDESALSMPMLANVTTEDAFYSYERETPYEEATSLLSSYQNSYDELETLTQQATTQGDMNLLAQKMYENSDTCLNSIWNLVRYNTDEDEFTTILEEQRTWIAQKEAAKESIYAEWGGGSGEPLAEYSALTEMTMERCKVLTEYLAEDNVSASGTWQATIDSDNAQKILLSNLSDGTTKELTVEDSLLLATAVDELRWFDDNMLAVISHVNPSLECLSVYDVNSMELVVEKYGDCFQWASDDDTDLYYIEHTPHFSDEVGAEYIINYEGEIIYQTSVGETLSELAVSSDGETLSFLIQGAEEARQGNVLLEQNK